MFEKLYNWIKAARLKAEENMENPLKVQAQINALNLAEKPTPGLLPGQVPNVWIAIQGNFALTGFQYGKENSPPVFNGQFGYPVKLFFNSLTRELKMFPATFFEN